MVNYLKDHIRRKNQKRDLNSDPLTSESVVFPLPYDACHKMVGRKELRSHLVYDYHCTDKETEAERV